MPIAGWLAVIVVALISALNVTTANNSQIQNIAEEAIPVVEQLNLPTAVPELDSALTQTQEPEITEVTEGPVQVPEPTTASVKVEKPVTTRPESLECHPSYSGCLDPNTRDYDCTGGSGNGPYYTGPVRVLGPDVFDLDRDNDGMACE